MNALLTTPLAITIAHRESIVAVREGLWRVVNPRGILVGHIQAVPESLGQRFHALRFHSAAGVFRSIGSFWSPDEALRALRY